MFTGNNKIIAAIDIGGSKIASIIAKIHGNESVKILGVGVVASSGVKNGLIHDMKLLRSAIASSLCEAERQAGKSVDTVIVNIANPIMKSSLVTITSKFMGKQILSRDLTKVINAALSKVDLSKYEIIYYTTLEHDLDEMLGVKDPEFMFANNLTSYINIITIPVKFLINLSTCFLGCQLKITDFVISSYASAMVVTTDHERDKGCIVVDIGGDLLDYVVIKNNRIITNGVLPIGGNTITKDIANYFSIDSDEAEKIKILYGKLSMFYSDEDSIISVKSIGHQQNDSLVEISNELLNKVIKARFKEIISIFIKKMREKRLDEECLRNVIFTGGSSQFIGLESFLKEELGLIAKKGLPINFSSASDIELNSSLATLYGLVKYSIHQNDQSLLKKSNSVTKAISWLKQNF